MLVFKKKSIHEQNMINIYMELYFFLIKNNINIYFISQTCLASSVYLNTKNCLFYILYLKREFIKLIIQIKF